MNSRIDRNEKLNVTERSGKSEAEGERGGGRRRRLFGEDLSLGNFLKFFPVLAEAREEVLTGRRCPAVSGSVAITPFPARHLIRKR